MEEGEGMCLPQALGQQDGLESCRVLAGLRLVFFRQIVDGLSVNNKFSVSVPVE